MAVGSGVRRMGYDIGGMHGIGSERAGLGPQQRTHAADGAACEPPGGQRTVNGVTLRPSLAAFAVHMERMLRLNDHRGDWRALPAEFFLRRLPIEVGELELQVRHGGPDVLDKAVDVANYVMFIAGIMGELPPDPPRRPAATQAVGLPEPEPDKVRYITRRRRPRIVAEPDEAAGSPCAGGEDDVRYTITPAGLAYLGRVEREGIA